MESSTSPRKTLNARTALFTLLIASTLGLAFALPAEAAQPTVGLGSAQSFAVLAGSGITNTGPTTVSGTQGGDMGSSPTTTFTGEVDVTTTGTKYAGPSSVVDDAKDDLVTAYLDAASRVPAVTLTGDLGGQTLTQGVYSGGALGLTGTLILDGGNDDAAVFIFQAESTLTTADSSSIQLTNGAQACNVFWQVGSSATFGTGSQFSGTVLALTSITATTGASFNGQLLARNGAVTLDTNTIVNDACIEAVIVPFEQEPEAEQTPAPSPAPVPEDSTEDGGVLPETGRADWLVPLAIGLGVATLATAAYLRARRSA